VRRDKAPANAYTKAKLDADAASTGILTIPLYFENVAPDDFSDKVTAQATIQMADGSSTAPAPLVSTRVLKGDSTAVYTFSLDVRKFKGDGTIRLIANPRLLPEQQYFNNELSMNFTAPALNVPPMLDVAFDGSHILNGDIVSPNPEIRVDVKYQDLRQPLSDPNKVELYLTRPGSTMAEKVQMVGNASVGFQVESSAGRAVVTYKPGTLTDGKYKLEAQATDMNGNTAGAQRFAVEFEVISTSSITNIYPYPNPVTSKTRFVFTLTGAELPRNMKIQILTLTGKVVREIMQNELGPLRIGNNITEYSWDGTDTYGDRLANGTYLYRVVLDDPTNKFEHRRTAGDSAFKNNWGKLVLLR
jgi:flagellar hook assembly protein FlgD